MEYYGSDFAPGLVVIYLIMGGLGRKTASERKRSLIILLHVQQIGEYAVASILCEWREKMSVPNFVSRWRQNSRRVESDCLTKR